MSTCDRVIQPLFNPYFGQNPLWQALFGQTPIGTKVIGPLKIPPKLYRLYYTRRMGGKLGGESHGIFFGKALLELLSREKTHFSHLKVFFSIFFCTSVEFFGETNTMSNKELCTKAFCGLVYFAEQASELSTPKRQYCVFFCHWMNFHVFQFPKLAQMATHQVF